MFVIVEGCENCQIFMEVAKFVALVEEERDWEMVLRAAYEAAHTDAKHQQ